jgi:hypothetical protein
MLKEVHRARKSLLALVRRAARLSLRGFTESGKNVEGE